MSDEISVNYAALWEKLKEHANYDMVEIAKASSSDESLRDDIANHINDFIPEAVRDVLDDVFDERIEDYLNYSFDVESHIDVQEHVNDSVEGLLQDVGSSTLCFIGETFKDAIETIMVSHLDMNEVVQKSAAYTLDANSIAAARKALTEYKEKVKLEEQAIKLASDDIDRENV
jgi:FtsZ-binding cell division protein ZapB